MRSLPPQTPPAGGKEKAPAAKQGDGDGAAPLPGDPGRCGGFRGWAGTLLFRIPEMNQECPRGMRRAEWQRAGEGRARLITEPPGIQRSVPEEAVHREGRCAPSGEAPDRGVPAAVR